MFLEVTQYIKLTNDTKVTTTSSQITCCESYQVLSGKLHVREHSTGPSAHMGWCLGRALAYPPHH